MGNLIDFRQVITQIVGFLIFLWLVRKYAWTPILATLEARREKIASDLSDAEARKREAAELKTELEQKLRGIEVQARTRIQEAMTEGQAVAAQIKADAQEQARARVARGLSEIESEKAKAEKALHEDLTRMAILAAEKILRKKLDEAEQRRLIAEFIGGVREVR